MATARKRRVEVEIVVDDKQVGQKLGNIEKSVTKTGKAFSNMGKAVALAVGAKALGSVVGAAQDSVRAFSDLNESVNAVEVTFGGASEGILELGEAAATSVGLSNAEFNSFAVGFSAFVDQIAAEKDGDIVETMNVLTVRIADFASVMNLDIPEAAEKFRSGLAGETEPLRKFGIDVSAAAVNSKALALGLGDASGKLSEQEKILARFELIMDQTDKTAGDFANTIDDYANAQRVATAEIENSKVAIGEALVPAFAAVIPLMVAAAESAGVIAIQFSKMTGAVDGAEGTLQQYAIQSGFAVDSATVLAGALVKLDDSLRTDANNTDILAEQTAILEGRMMELIDAADLSFDEMLTLAGGMDFLTDEMGFGEVAADILSSTLENRLNPAAQRMFLALEHATEGVEDLGDEAEDTGEDLVTMADIMRGLTDPAFAAISAFRSVIEKQETLNEVVSEFGENSDEAALAGVNLLEAYAGLITKADTYSKVAGVGLNQSIFELGALAEVPREVLDGIIQLLDEIDGKTVEATIVLNTPGGGKVSVDIHNLPEFEHGGIVPGRRGSQQLILAHGGETVLPTDRDQFTDTQLRIGTGTGANRDQLTDPQLRIGTGSGADRDQLTDPDRPTVGISPLPGTTPTIPAKIGTDPSLNVRGGTGTGTAGLTVELMLKLDEIISVLHEIDENTEETAPGVFTPLQPVEGVEQRHQGFDQGRVAAEIDRLLTRRSRTSGLGF